MITVHGMKNCGNCTKLENLLKKHKICYTYINSKKDGEKPQIHYVTKYFDMWLIGYEECRDFILYKHILGIV